MKSGIGLLIMLLYIR